MIDNSLSGSASERFPPTRHSAIIALGDGDAPSRERALESIAQVYWRPVYAYLRLKWKRDREDARDLTQEFFLRLLEKNFLTGYDPTKARFRTFLRVCLDRFVQKADAAAARLKRGGGVEIVTLDIETLESDMNRSAYKASGDVFDREWTRSLLERAITMTHAELEAGGHLIAFELFEKHDLAFADRELSPRYADMSAEFGISVETVTNQLALARRTFRRCVLEILREITADEEEFRAEARALLGFESP